jgi:UDP-N-acetyl-2-amino-2-deoxyglucuronate dehydrogenase
MAALMHESARLRVALIGAGQVAQVHLTALAATGAVELVGIFDQDAARAQSAAGHYHVARIYQSWDELLQDDTVQCVGVLLPHDMHERFTVEALSAGKHVVCEKPLGQTMDQMQRMLQAASDNGRALFPVHNRVYSRAIERLHDIVATGQIGQVVLAQTNGFEGEDTVGVRPWLATPRGGGGVLIAQAVHPAYILRWLLGEVTRVSCQFGDVKVVDMSAEDTAIVTLKFDSGAVAEMTATFGIAYGPFEHSVVLHGREGYARVGVTSRNGLQVISPRLYGDTALHDEQISDVDAPASGFRRMWEDYARGIVDGAPTRVSGVDGQRAVAIILAAYESNASGRSISIS